MLGEGGDRAALSFPTSLSKKTRVHGPKDTDELPESHFVATFLWFMLRNLASILMMEHAEEVARRARRALDAASQAVSKDPTWARRVRENWDHNERVGVSSTQPEHKKDVRDRLTILSFAPFPDVALAFAGRHGQSSRRCWRRWWRSARRARRGMGDISPERSGRQALTPALSRQRGARGRCGDGGPTTPPRPLAGEGRGEGLNEAATTPRGLRGRDRVKPWNDELGGCGLLRVILGSRRHAASHRSGSDGVRPALTPALSQRERVQQTCLLPLFLGERRGEGRRQESGSALYRRA